MQNCFTFIDVELANPSHDSICALGIIHVRDGNTVFSHEYIIDPACSFSSFHTNLHGITPEICNGKPCFPDVWKEVSSYFEAGIVVAHSATSMDLNAICQTLMHYQLPVPEIHYLCTLELAKKYIPKKSVPNYTLPSLCDYLGVPVQHHHNALADALMCHDVFFAMLSRFGFYADAAKVYHLPEKQSPCYHVSHEERPFPIDFDAFSSGDISGRAFLLTGDFEFGTRASVETYIEKRGGIIKSVPSKRLDYLLVGNLGSENWKYGNYGTKVETILEYRRSGLPVKVISESDFFNAVIPEYAAPALDFLSPESVMQDILRGELSEFAPHLSLAPLKGGSISFKCVNTLAFRFNPSAATPYVEFRETDMPEDDVSQIGKKYQLTKQKPAYWRITVDATFSYKLFIKYAKSILKDILDGMSYAFACCDRFIECSDAKHCLFPKDQHHLGCYYRRNLRAGKIFYGKNKNYFPQDKTEDEAPSLQVSQETLAKMLDAVLLNPDQAQ